MTGPFSPTGPLGRVAAHPAPSAAPVGGTRAGAASGTPVIAGAGLVKRFGTTVALAGVDVAVAAGESLAIMGPSGSGKSTLLHCLAGIMRPDSGTVTLLGERIDDLGENRRSALRRTRFGFVFQFGQLLPELPAEENVALPLMLGGMPAGRAVAQARTWFGPLGLAGMERRRPGELSGGQAQRVALARALVTGPSIVFADEPTGALDQATGHETMRLLVETTRHHGASLILVTHDPQVAAWCNRIIEVQDGRLVGNPAGDRGHAAGASTRHPSTGWGARPGPVPYGGSDAGRDAPGGRAWRAGTGGEGA